MSAKDGVLAALVERARAAEKERAERRAAEEVALRTAARDAMVCAELRDRFAMAALTGYLASFGPGEPFRFEDLARDCYNTADAMLAAREAK